MSNGGENMRWVVGIDEVGRGPLAGPVAVGVVMVPAGFDWSQLPGVNDSKQLTEERREVVYRAACLLRRQGVLDFAVAKVSAAVIDRVGIIAAIEQAMGRALKRVVVNFVDPRAVRVQLDGGLRAPKHFLYQETIVKGDSKEKTIGLASITAKVERDRYMQRLAGQNTFAPYGFADHKGYGTVQHRTAIAKCGLTVEHRRSYCKNIEIIA